MFGLIVTSTLETTYPRWAMVSRVVILATAAGYFVLLGLWARATWRKARAYRERGNGDT